MVLKYIYIKFQAHKSTGSGVEDFKSFIFLTNFFPSAPGSAIRNLVITGSVTFEEMFEIIILHMTVLGQR